MANASRYGLPELTTTKPKVIKQPDANSPSKSAQLLAEIMLRTDSKRKQRSLSNVWSALEHLRQMKSRDFTAASVARAIEALKLPGPKAQSIRNAEGQDFRDIIRAYESEYGEKTNRLSGCSDPDDFLYGISDLRTAARVRELLADYRSSQRQINMLKNLISQLSPVEIDDDLSFAPLVAKELAAPTAHPEFSPLEINSVVSFLKEIEESGECLNIRFDSSSGALLWKEGALELAAPGFFHILTKIAAKGK